VRIGITILATAESIDLRDLGQAAESLGYDSLFIPEHTHIPVGRQSAFPLGEVLPDEYPRMLDPFVALAAVASVTQQLLLGTGICLVPQHDPILLAKVVATLDNLSGGRVLFGVGAGWNREEAANHGTDPNTRWEVMEERLEAMQQIWTMDEAEFHGKYVDFDPIWAWPKPVQRPHPPIMLGGAGKRAIERVATIADEWMPMVHRADNFLTSADDVRRRCEEVGRPAMPITAFGVKARAEVLKKYRDAGAQRCVITMPSAPKDVVLERLTRCAELIEH
jgi:probable F420-dependent oxidoreductase